MHHCSSLSLHLFDRISINQSIFVKVWIIFLCSSFQDCLVYVLIILFRTFRPRLNFIFQLFQLVFSFAFRFQVLIGAILRQKMVMEKMMEWHRHVTESGGT